MSQSDSTVPNYKDTLQLPLTNFPMKADLVQREPTRLKKWDDAKLYQTIQNRRRGSKKFVLHDGPPFTNGDAHMGTALNKILKDLVVKSKTMAGFHAPFVPGFDCHGLPIEYKVVKETAGLTPLAIRQKSEAFARGWIAVQTATFQRLGVLGEWENPYITLTPAYEADVLRVFAQCVEQNLVYRGRRPVMWSYGAKTPIAEVDVDYKEKTSPAVYVAFPALSGPAAEANAAYVIWTTTPWTLPANLGIALHPDFTYVLGTFQHEKLGERNLIILKDLVEAFSNATGWTYLRDGEPTTFKGRDLTGHDAQHPFLPRVSQVIPADFVTAETGTGAVHLAPGHGHDDYFAGLAHGFAVLSPVDDDGKYTAEVGLPDLVGTHVFAANEPLIQLLAEKNALLGQHQYTHQYPFCQRSGTPVIYRAVEQYFIRINDIRQKALDEIDRVAWLPARTRNRIHGTVEARPDWCISRQRTWGIPLPVFYDPNGAELLDVALVRQIADEVEQHGSNLWFAEDDAAWCARLALPPGCTRGRDTLDVWIDSGSSHAAVLSRHPDLYCPADLYLEATDQHRGWFQSSLMLGIIARGSAPYKTVLTHGFVTDPQGKKLAKSSGKPVNVKNYYEKYGADLVRLWVASVDYTSDIHFSEELFAQQSDVYRRLRNTLRILLGNLHGFRPDTDARPVADFTLLDRWISERLHQVTRECIAAYEALDFRRVFTVLNQFCSADLSSLYVDLTKDRLYCDAPASPRRQATQTVMHALATSLCQLLAPILAFTADEAWEHLGHKESVHLELFPTPDSQFSTTAATDEMEALLKHRALIQQEIEKARQGKLIGSNNEALVVLNLPPAQAAALAAHDPTSLLEFFMVSTLLIQEAAAPSAEVTRTPHAKCPRCWRYEPDIGAEPTHPLLCERCAEAVESHS